MTSHTEPLTINEQIKRRNFQLWDFWVSHSQLLLRSPISEIHSANVDLRFRAVEHIDLPTSLSALTFDEPTSKDRAQIHEKLGRELYDDEKLFVLLCEQRRHYIVALHISVEENELDIFDSTLQRQW